MAIKRWTRDEIKYSGNAARTQASLENASGVLSYGYHHDYRIFVFNTRQGPLIKMGCRLFTIEQARQHWGRSFFWRRRAEFMKKLIPVIEFEAFQMDWVKERPKAPPAKREVVKRKSR